MAIRVLIVDDHLLVRKGLRAVLEGTPDIEVVEEAENGREALDRVRETAPDVVLMDLSMPGLNGIEATRRIAEEAPNTHALALSVQSDRQLVDRMLEAGADGYVMKDSAVEELVEAIRTVAAGEIVLSPRVAGIVLDRYVRQGQGDVPQKAAALTPRQQEVLQLIAEGRHTKQIAHELDISPKTVEMH